MEVQDITYYITHYSYFGIFIWFFIIDQTTPIPEELVLMTIGYISHSDIVNPYLAGLMALLGLMTIDNTYFLLATKGNKWIEKAIKKKPGQLLNKFQDQLNAHPVATLFTMSFIPKVRFLMPIIAGLNNITYKQFFLINTSASLLFVGFYLSLGFIFHNSIEHITNQVNSFRNSILGILIIIVAIIMSIYIGKWLWNKMS